MRVETDALDYAIEGVLSTKCEDGKWRPVVTVVLWTSSHILYSLPLHQKGNVSKATC